MASMVAAALCLSALCTHAVKAQCGETLLAQNFDRHTGEWTDWNRNMAEQDFPVGLGYTKAIERASVGDGAMRVIMPAGGVGPGGTGMLMRVDLPREVPSATLSYSVKFDEGYDWTAGGKLPGLCDSDCPTGCKNMDEHPGWSSRIMFRPGGAAESYMYYPNMKDFGTCGKSWPTPFKFSAGAWHQVTLYIKLNEGGANNGEQKVWIDGQEVLSKNDIKFRPGSGNLIKQLKFEAFHGGKSDQFKPSKTQYIAFDNFVVHEGFCPGGSTTQFTESDAAEELPEDMGVDSEGPTEFSADTSSETFQDEVFSTADDGDDGYDGDGDDAAGPSMDVLGRFGNPGGDGKDGKGDGDSDNGLDFDFPENNDEEIDDDDNDDDHDCGSDHEPVCTQEQIIMHDREFECDYGFHNDGEGICVDWTEAR